MITQAHTVQQFGGLQQMSFARSSESLRSTERIKEVAQEFEALFIEQLLKQADKTLNHEDNIMYGGHAEDVFRGMFNQELAHSMAQGGGFGLAEMLEAEMVASTNTGIKE